METLILHPDTSISACIVLTMVGFSVNGRLTQPKSLWSELLTIGKKKKNIA